MLFVAGLLGGECHNSSSQSPEGLKVFWKALEALYANTAEIPVYWELLEKEEGIYDFTQTDWIIKESTRRGFKLILLWFATWKNAVCSILGKNKHGKISPGSDS
jgi:beta-galactosidase GanA